MSEVERLLAERRDAYRVEERAALDLPGRPTRDPRAQDIGKSQARVILADQVARLSAFQEQLYADRRWSVLLILQAMDAGGKDGTIKHVLSGVNPQGLGVVSFKAPGFDDLSHDFLWRVHRVCPARGMIGVFNRSHYEEVVVTRVRPSLVAAQNLPDAVASGPTFWEDRLADIRAFESYLGRQGTRIVKVFLHVGREEQKRRLLARLDDPAKHWKFDPDDLGARARWDDYMSAYAEAIAGTSTPDASWHVVPADQKWFARIVVADILLATFAALGLEDPKPTAEQERQIVEARRTLA